MKLTQFLKTRAHFNLKTITLFISFLILLLNFTAAQIDSISTLYKPKIFPGWTLWVPGATHFYEKNFTRGVIFSATEVGGITLGIIWDKNLKTQSSTPYYNYPLLLGMQAYNVDKCDWLRNRLGAIKYYSPDFNYDPISFNDLLKAPFKPENIFTPVTGGFVLAAVAELYLSGRHASQNFRDVEQIYVVDHYMNRDPAMLVFGTTSLAAGYGAGVAEEYYFRNAFLPLLDYKYGQRKGLIFSSLFFGSLHFTNVLMSEKPDYSQALLQVAEASIAGYFLGRDVQKRGYNIGPAVAAHTWYDFTLMLGSFLIDPENNFLGVNMKFKIQ